MNYQSSAAVDRIRSGRFARAAGRKGFFSFSRLQLCAILFIFFGLLPGTAGADQPTAGEYQVKAAFILNFAGFVEWPEESLSPEKFIIGTLGQNPFGGALEALNGKTAKGRNVVVMHFDEPEEALVADIVFVSASERRSLRHALNTLQKRPILVVGDSRGFADAGVMINMVVVQKRVGFEINSKAAKKAGILISSQLLKLAKEVVE